MKKILAFILVAAFAFGLVACKDDVPIDPVTTKTASIAGTSEVTITVGDSFDAMAGVTATDSVSGDLTSSIVVTGTVNLNNAGNYTLTYKVTGSDGKEVTATRSVIVLSVEGCPINQEKVNGVCVVIPATDIVIMHGAPFEVDPFHENYTGTEQLAKQNKQREVEEQFNVNIIYRPYPANAPWGPDRVSAISQSSASGNHLADIYWSTSDWIQSLVKDEAIVPIDQYLPTTGQNIDSSVLEIGTYLSQRYAFETGKLTVDVGLYYNASLVENLGVDNPTQLFLDGLWTWSRFDTWATQVQTMLTAQADDMHALGGMLSYYAESMIPLNGGSLINASSGRVAFAQNPALETYSFLNSLYTKGLFELAPLYDAGSPEWQAGKVAIHPGSLWFVNSDMRWGGLAFELGFVPYPRSDSYTGDYASPVSGVAVYHIASGMTPEKEALVFQVWNELQLWKTDQQLKDAFELSLLTKFDDELYAEAYLEIYDKTYLDLANAIGISAYSENGWRRNANLAIREGTARTVMDGIKPIYEAALERYLTGNE